MTTQDDAATVSAPDLLQLAKELKDILVGAGMNKYEADIISRPLTLMAAAAYAPILKRAEAQAYYAGAKAMRDVCAQIAKDQSREMGNQQWELAADQIYENIIVAEVLKP